MAGYVPRRGDFIYLTFDPQSGHEQRGRRPAFVISEFLFNQATGLCFVCPITNTNRKIPFHYPILNSSLTGFVMVEQLKSVDFRARNAQFIEQTSPEMISEILGLVGAILL
jgi:mRNA interferase MazF